MLSNQLRSLLYSVYCDNNEANLEDCELFWEEADYEDIKSFFDEDVVTFDDLTKELDSLLKEIGHDTLIITILRGAK